MRCAVLRMHAGTSVSKCALTTPLQGIIWHGRIYDVTKECITQIDTIHKPVSSLLLPWSLTRQVWADLPVDLPTMADQKDVPPSTTEQVPESKIDQQSVCPCSVRSQPKTKAGSADELATFYASNAKARARYSKAVEASREKMSKVPEQVRHKMICTGPLPPVCCTVWCLSS